MNGKCKPFQANSERYLLYKKNVLHLTRFLKGPLMMALKLEAAVQALFS